MIRKKGDDVRGSEGLWIDSKKLLDQDKDWKSNCLFGRI